MAAPTPISTHTIERVIIKRSCVPAFFAGMYVAGWGSFIWWSLVDDLHNIQPGMVRRTIVGVAGVALFWPILMPMGMFGAMIQRAEKIKGSWKSI